MNQISSEQYIESGEIDLLALIEQIWQQKWLIACCTMFFAVIAAIYIFMSSPVYLASSGVMPPRLSDISGYNLGRGEAELEEYKVEDVYNVFKKNLLSGTLKHKFYEEFYLPSLSLQGVNIARDQLWKRFNEEFHVVAPDKVNNPDYFVVKVEGSRPELTAEWANTYVNMAAEISLKDMQLNLQTEIGTKIQSLSRQIDSIRITAMKRREDRIVRLKEALVIAKAVGYDSPQVTPAKTSSDGDFAEFMDGNLMYMRGAKAVEAELAILQKRTNDDPFITELRDIENQLDFLQNIDIEPGNVAVFTLDSPALVPETPVKPKKAVILTLGFVLGGMLGVFIAILRVLVNRRVEVVQ